MHDGRIWKEGYHNDVTLDGPLLMFSSVCILDSSVLVPVTLNAWPSFPGCRVRVLPRELPPTTKAWAAQPVQQDGSHLDLTLTKPVGEGRIGMTYVARMNSAKDASEVDSLASGLVPPELFLKITKPQFCQSMVREAWFYEQMCALQDVAIVRCFGFLTATLKGARMGLLTDNEACDNSESLATTLLLPCTQTNMVLRRIPFGIVGSTRKTSHSFPSSF